MQAVILAAGKGTRMKSLTASTPKPMLCLFDTPLLDYKIRYLPKEITEVILVVGYNRAVIEEYFGDSFDNRKISYVVQEELNGTYGALQCARELLEDTFLVIMGDDCYLQSDIEKLMQYDYSILLRKLEVPTITGLVKIGSDGKLLSVQEKQEAQPGDLINCAAYVLKKEFLSEDPVALPNGEYGLPQTLAKLATKRDVHTVLADAWLSVTSPEDLQKAEEKMEQFYPKT